MMQVAGLAKAKFDRLMAEISMRSGLNLSKPTFICAKMTMRCNSRCVHCNIWNMDIAEQELETAQWLHLLDELRAWLGRFRIYFTGGEALMRPDMTTILAYAVNLGITVELLSNGLLIDEALAGKIVATGIDQITISLDGFTPGVHDRFRGEPGYHDQTVAAVLLLNRFRREMGSPLRILLKTVISANNLHELEAIAQWAQEHKIDLLFQPLEQNYGETSDPAWYRNSSLWITDLPLLKKVLVNLRCLREKGGCILNTNAEFDRYYSYFEQPEILMASIQAHYSKNCQKYCPSAVGSFVISSNGDVRMCFGMEPIGNVLEVSPQELWRRRERCWTKSCAFR